MTPFELNRQKIAEELASIDWPLWPTYDEEDKKTILHSPSYIRNAEFVLKHKADAYEACLKIYHVNYSQLRLKCELQDLALIP